MTQKEIKDYTVEKIIASIFYKGIAFSGDSATKKDEKELQQLFRELERRGVVEDWEAAYAMTNH